MQAALVRLPCCVELASSTTIPSKTSTHKAYMLNRNRSLTLRLTSLFSRLGSLIVRIQSVFSSSSLLSSDLFSINKRHCIQLHAVSTICTLTFHTNSFIFRFISHRSLISFWQKKKKCNVFKDENYLVRHRFCMLPFYFHNMTHYKNNVLCK